MIEIELKAHIKDRQTLLNRAAELGYTPAAVLDMRDVYYNGDARGFHATDEALRLRTVIQNGTTRCFITYKGPKNDPRTSTRTEHETGVDAPEAAHGILTALGFSPAFTVKKRRQELTGFGLTLCVDAVEGLGDYIELERVISDPAEREAGIAALFCALDALGIPESAVTRRSYLELLYFPDNIGGTV